MLNSSFCDYSDAYIFVEEEVTINGAEDDVAARKTDERIKIFKNCAPFINCKCEINNMEIDNAKDIDIAIPMCNFIEYSEYYSISSLLRHHRLESSILLSLLSCFLVLLSRNQCHFLTGLHM